MINENKVNKTIGLAAAVGVILVSSGCANVTPPNRIANPSLNRNAPMTTVAPNVRATDRSVGLGDGTAVNRGFTRSNLNTPNNAANRSTDTLTRTPDTAGNNVNRANRAGVTDRATLDTGTAHVGVALDHNVKLAKSISAKLSGMDEFQSATVAVNGNTALVGVRASNRAAADEAGLKELAIKRVKDMDSSIKNVVVTMAPDMYTRIENLASDISNGKTIQGMSNEFSEIGRRIMPARG